MDDDDEEEEDVELSDFELTDGEEDGIFVEKENDVLHEPKDEELPIAGSFMQSLIRYMEL
jgi:hypothetical protein